jgi:hypothetical protein
LDFGDRVRDLRPTIPQPLEYISAEEAAENLWCLPFMSALDYSVGPRDVKPEHTSDI